MDKYFLTQVKRLWRILPVVFLVMSILLGSVYMVFQGLMRRWEENDTTQKFNIGLVGTAGNSMFQIGLEAVTTMDSSNMTISLIEMEEQQAVSALRSGEIAAYVVFSDDFLNNAFMGQIEPLRFVSTSGSENLLSLVKEELTSSIAALLLSSEYGAFGLSDALAHYGYDSATQDTHINRIAIQYAQQVLERDMIYQVELIGYAEGYAGVEFGQYMLCGLSVLFLYLLTLPFVTVFVKAEHTFGSLLKSQRIGAVRQVLAESIAYTLFFFVLSLGILAFIERMSFVNALHMLPVAFSVASISYLVYNLCRDFLSGVLVQMVVAIAFCFVSGCIYPAYFLPVSVQTFAKYLPTAVAREHLSHIVLGDNPAKTGLLLTTIAISCTAVTACVRHLHIAGKGEYKR